MAKTIIEYVIEMVKAGRYRELTYRLEALLAILDETDKYTYVHDDIIKAVCRMSEELPDADF